MMAKIFSVCIIEDTYASYYLRAKKFNTFKIHYQPIFVRTKGKAATVTSWIFQESKQRKARY